VCVNEFILNLLETTPDVDTWKNITERVRNKYGRASLGTRDKPSISDIMEWFEEYAATKKVVYTDYFRRGASTQAV